MKLWQKRKQPTIRYTPWICNNPQPHKHHDVDGRVCAGVTR